MSESRKQWIIVGAVVALLAALVGVGWANRGSFLPLDVGSEAPAFTATDLQGRPVSLADLRGQVVLLNIWATWCGPCRAEMPAMERAYQKHGPSGFAVLAVDVQERDPEVLAFLREVGATFPSAMDTTGEASRTWRAVGLPTSFLIDRQGIIRDVRVGPFTDEMLEERVSRLLQS